MLRSLALAAKRPQRAAKLNGSVAESVDEPPILTEALLSDHVKSKTPDILGGWSPKWSPGTEGYEVPYKFRIDTRTELASSDDLKDAMKDSKLTYTHFIGNRFPTLETAENYRYWKERGLDRLLPKVFPIFLPTHRRIHPLLRAYIFYLHDLDPKRFTVRRIAERYGIKEHSIVKIMREYRARKFIDDSGLTSTKLQQITKEEKVLSAKEKAFAKAVGYEISGNQDIEDERELADDFDGWSTTSDFVRQQSIEVESFSAFPLPHKRNPITKRVDVDLCIAHNRRVKVVNWIDPTEKIVF